MRLGETLQLSTASRYQNPASGSQVLPVVYGDLLSDAGASEAGGIVPAVLIDKFLLAFLVNDGPSDPTLPEVYVGTQLTPQFSGSIQLWAYDPAYNDGLGNIVSIVQFFVQPTDTVSVRMKGMVDGTGQFISNPIVALQHFFTTYGNWLAEDFDPYSVYAAEVACDQLNYTMHWVFDAHRTYGEWLVELMANILADTAETVDGTLRIVVDQDATVAPEAILWHFDASEDLEPVGGDPEDNPRCRATIEDIITVYRVKGQYSWATQTYHAELVVRLEALISRYGERYSELNLPGIRTAAHWASWSTAYSRRIAGLNEETPVSVPTIVTFSVPSLRYIGILPTSKITLTWAWAPSVDGSGWHQRILKVLQPKHDVDFGRHRTEFVCWDTGITYGATTYALLLAGATTWYLWVDELGYPQVSATIPAQQALNAGTPWDYLIRQSPDSTTWYISLDAAGSYVISSVLPAGTGYSGPLRLINQRSAVYDVGVDDSPQLLMIRVA